MKFGGIIMKTKNVLIYVALLMVLGLQGCTTMFSSENNIDGGEPSILREHR